MALSGTSVRSFIWPKCRKARSGEMASPSEGSDSGYMSV